MERLLGLLKKKLRNLTRRYHNPEFVDERHRHCYKGLGTSIYARIGRVEGSSSSQDWDELELNTYQVEKDNLTVENKSCKKTSYMIVVRVWTLLSILDLGQVVELQRHQAFSIKCDIETKMLSPDTAYACYLVFQLPENSEGLKDKRVPENREDGWMQIIIWEFVYNNEIKDNYIPMELKLSI
ncbi:phloem protein 2-like protein [Artemisia annua]|uniref:Phloem protein 2-like protein n=1 Tax=Artemisia annua TaxID=35608 RepID=A0A2U1P6W1_ARTAN|nr:phloem protein 2-like protein [Artemisia annua]